MNMNASLAAQVNFCSGFVPVDMQTGANTGDWVSLKNYERCTIILFKAAGTNGDDPTITVNQASDVSGTGSKALNFTRLHRKQGTLTSVGTYTETTQSAANTYTNTDLAENQAIILIDIKAEDLDVDNGFDCVQVTVEDVGSNAQLGCALYALWGARYGGSLPTAITD